MSRPVWAAGLLTLALALPAQATTEPMPVKPSAPITVPVATIPEATAIQVARSLFPIALVQADPTVSLTANYTGHSAWQIAWEGETIIHVTVDARDGQVLMADRWTNGPTVPGTTRLTTAEAEQQAALWLAKMAPGAQASLVAIQSIGSEWYDPFGYSFQYEWHQMGYPVPEAGANLRIDASTGELLSWYLNRPDGQMVLPPAILAESEARAAFAKLPLALSYSPAYWMNEPILKEAPVPFTQTMLLAYRPPSGVVLSQSGLWIGLDGQPLPDVTLPAWKQVPSPVSPYKPPAEPLSKAESMVIAQAVSGLSREPDLVSLSRWDGRLTYNFGWIDWTMPEGGETHVVIDAVRGLVQEIWSNQPMAEGAPVLTPAEAQQAAVTFIQTYRPDLAGALYYPGVQPLDGGNRYAFTFERQHEGIMLEGYGVQLWIDGMTGKVLSFWGHSQDPELILPEPKGILPPGPLMAKLVEVAGVELGWMRIQPTGAEPFYQLVWQLGQGVPVSLIEAQTGIFRDAEGTDVLRFRLPPTDVAGHWAEREVMALFAQRILTAENGRFMPEQTMTESEAAAWLARLAYSGPRPVDLTSKDGEMIAPGEPHPAAPITREEFVRRVVVALGYEKIASMTNQIWMPFHDQAMIEPGARNAVAVLNGLGVIQGTPEGNFLPKKSLTRAEAARILFQSLAHRRFGYSYK